MAAKVPGKGQRLSIINRQITRGAADIRPILLKARDKMDLRIIKSAKKRNFLTSARVRDTLYSDLRKEYIALQGDVDTWGAKQATNAAREWRKLAIADIPPGLYDQTWAQFSKKHLEDIVARVNPNNAARLAAVKAPSLSPALGGMLQKDITFLRQNVVEVFRLGAATGMTAAETRKELLVRTTTERPAWQFIDSAGKTWDTENYFKMLDRTIANNASRSAYMDVMTEAGQDVAQIEGGVTASVTNPNDPCAEWAGRIISLTGATEGLPTLADAEAAGVFHPRCRHYLGVVLADEFGEAKRKETRESKKADVAREASEKMIAEEKAAKEKARAAREPGGKPVTKQAQEKQKAKEDDAALKRRLAKQDRLEPDPAETEAA